jgi:hypothetical protein
LTGRHLRDPPEKPCPFVILDGFDELLQATGVSQTDYLMKVADFQRREADQDRPVAMIVTSRTSVADRARTPDGSLSLRLEPFDDERVTAWLDVWNSTNVAHFRARGLSPLTAQTVLAHRDLAEQPLLLLMLALYDAVGNALQRGSADLHQDELYERLLRSFASREVAKHRPGLSDRDLDHAVEEELRRLSVVAFAMFNRASQWVTEADHATFGEFLVARLTWQVLRDIAAREAASTMSLAAAPVNDDLLHALLSFAALSQRTPIVGFLTDMTATLNDADRAALTGLLLWLFRVVHRPRSGRGLATYQPRALPVPARHATYSANLAEIHCGRCRLNTLGSDQDARSRSS